MAKSPATISPLTNLAKAALGLGLGATVLSSSLYTIDSGKRAVIFDRLGGVKEATLGEGTHFLIPWLQKPFIFNIRTRAHTFSSISGTKDIQMVNLTLRALARPDADMLPTIFQNLGLEYDEKVLPSIGIDVLEDVVAQFNADQLLTEAPKVSAMIKDSLVGRAKNFNILLDDVAITDLSYGPEFFSRAVEQKQVAQQEAERSKFVVMKAEQERRPAIITAEGGSEAAKLISDDTAVAGMGLVELRKIEASKENVTNV